MKPKIILCLASLVIIAGLVAFGWHFIPKLHISKKSTESTVTTSEFYQVTEVVDGDTIKINVDGVKESVRLIGLDTPESKKPNSSIECFGLAASNYAHSLMDNQIVRLETDPINTNRDRYNRLLRYVYLQDGRLVNGEMIKKGFGFAYLSYPFTKSDEFRQYQIDARETDRGLWAEGACEIQNVNGRYKTNTI